uniref:Uncharacterized protein n=1 Tax=viral metagenome TaxID=1070528 RepID=A0A6C0E282_9ZZZZ
MDADILLLDTDLEEQKEVYVLTPNSAFDNSNNTVRMYIQYANINEWVVLPLAVKPDISLYKLADKCVALDETGNLVHSPFHKKVYPVTQAQLDKILYHMSYNDPNHIHEDTSLNYLVWQAYIDYIYSPQCTRRREEKKKRKEESEFWCY